MKKIVSAAAILLFSSRLAFSSEPAPVPQSFDSGCTFPGTNVPAPAWVCDEPVEGWEVTAPGSAEKSAAGYAFQKQMATTAARVALVQQTRAYVANMVKQYVSATGTGAAETVDAVNMSVTRQISEGTLVGSKVIKSVVGPDGRLWVLVGIDRAFVESLAKQAVATSLRNDRAIWQEIKARKADAELVQEIARQRGSEPEMHPEAEIPEVATVPEE